MTIFFKNDFDAGIANSLRFGSVTGKWHTPTDPLRTSWDSLSGVEITTSGFRSTRKTRKRTSLLFVCEVYHAPICLRCKFERGRLSGGDMRCKESLQASEADGAK